MINIFVGFVIVTFQSEGESAFQDCALDKNQVISLKLEYNQPNTIFQRNCIEFALSAKPVRRYIPKHPLQYRLWSFATSPFCEYTVFIAILLNTTSLAMKFYQQPTAYTDFLDVLNQIFTYFFLVECILKLGAFRFKVKHSRFVQNNSISSPVRITSEIPGTPSTFSSWRVP